jgi:hypothetical protein
LSPPTDGQKSITAGFIGKPLRAAFTWHLAAVLGHLKAVEIFTRTDCYLPLHRAAIILQIGIAA